MHGAEVERVDRSRDFLEEAIGVLGVVGTWIGDGEGTVVGGI